jgi:tagatose 1,6-diphosphate aldolase GatY/KbaY
MASAMLFLLDSFANLLSFRIFHFKINHKNIPKPYIFFRINKTKGFGGKMYIISTKAMLQKAQREGYAVPAFNIHNLETLQVVVETASELRSPDRCGHARYIQLCRNGNVVAIAGDLAKTYNQPLAIHLDHHEVSTI